MMEQAGNTGLSLFALETRENNHDYLFNETEIEHLFLNPERYYVKLLYERWNTVMLLSEEESRRLPNGKHIPALYLEILKKLLPLQSRNKEFIKDFFVLENFIFHYQFPVEKRDELRNKFRLVIIEYTNKREHDLFQKVFGDLSLEKMKKLALILTPDQAQSTTATTTTTEQATGPNSMTYGEIEFNSFLYILEWCKKEIIEKKFLPSNGLSFTDLGHGTGKAMMIVDSVFGSLFQQINGIELSYGLYTESVQRLQVYQEIIHSNKNNQNLLSEEDEDFLHFHPLQETVTEFHTFFGDFLEKRFLENNNLPVSFDWTQSDVVFANSTCFGYGLMQQIAQIAEASMKPNALFISLTFPLPSKKFETILERNLPMSWGIATCYIHRRRNDE